MKRFFSDRLRRLTAATALVTCTVAPTQLLAAGYDTPMLHTARHIGMAGTAISWADDPSAMFHNPAGLGNIGSGQFMLSLSPLMGQIQGCPNEDASLTATKPSVCLKSTPAASPFFLLGGAFRLSDRITVGIGAMPVGGAAGGYSYNLSKPKGLGANKTLVPNAYSVEDSAFLSFIEFTPTVAVQILDNLRLGVTWRPAYVMFTRERIRKDNETKQEFKDIALSDMKGFMLGGIRVGLQGNIGKLKLGAVYRNQSETEVEADEIYFSDAKFTGAKFGIKYPSKFGLGAAYEVIDRLTVAADFEYMLQSFNDITYLKGFNTGTQADDKVANKSNWQNSYTVRVGGQWKFNDSWVGRLGYIFDSPAVRPAYPTAFGSPPAATHFGTIGAGYEVSERLSLAFAAAVRNGSGSSDAPAPDCLFCGKEGKYGITLGGAYFDLVWKFGTKVKPAALAAK
jgi:long-subunit fatty acid transport protein